MPNKPLKKSSAVARGNASRRKKSARTNDPLSALNVITRLEVGPVRVERNRLIVPYTVIQNHKADATELIYRYEEDVFDPKDPTSLNLANLIGAQVALNYGLFCDEIVFHGPYDQTDRRFLEDAAKNTAQEIFVKKFLEPNPFLVGAAANLPAVKKKSYLRAKLRFLADPKADDAPALRNRIEWSWPIDRSRHLILSSGGKDSLLSYGLLHEAGIETHPVFINESGKHWFTALNAYRHFSAHVSHTARIWTNADRVFSWMLRHLPFIRSDFLNVRADEYPIRLWTVAVFLFGALPIARQRGIGRILIGDEYDSTQKTAHQGITHYNGYYDQSLYFDNAMTEYFARKRWHVSQFSVLRPLSELLIEKTLAEGYPGLLAHQMSCHAANKKDDRVRPCGQCEKCRRIVGMLKAVGADPQSCGYTSAQIENCLRALAEKGIHQESEGAEHMAHLLAQRNLIDRPVVGDRTARAQPHVLKLRFDDECSPVASIPADLRAAVYPIMLKYAAGAVRRAGGAWADFDPLSKDALAQSYPFEASSSGQSSSQPSPANRSALDGKFILGQLTWPEAQARFKRVDLALLPVGAIEQHGPHLPLDTDAFDAEYMARKVAEACNDPKPFVLPLIPYGVSYQHDDFSGTISVSNEALSRFVYDVGMNVARNGITKLIIVNGHGGNVASLHFAAQMINRDARIFTCVDTGDTSDADVERLAETPGDIHAGEIETSTSLAIRPELVQMDKARKYVPRFSSRYLDFSSKRSVDWYARTSKISRTGVMGDPTKASREKGRKMWEVMIRNLVEFVEHLKSMSLDEIHQRNRY